MKLFRYAYSSLLLILFSGASYAQVPQIERDALIALYNSTDGANWKDSAGWLGEVGTECTWFGVLCGSSKVTWLSLGWNKLTGTIPSELGNLTSLTNLHLGGNSLTGTIPAELGNLSNLTWLNLQLNSLTGTIPSEFGNLTNLTNFYINNNSLSGIFPREVSDLPKLTDTNYEGNLFTGSEFAISAEERDALIALYNSTDGVNWKDNTGWLGEPGTECTWFGVTCRSSKVTQLSLWQNKLTGTIPIELGNLSNLDWVQLSYNSLSGIIPSALGNLTKLKSLYLNSNSLSGNVPRELGNLLKLNSLYLQTNLLTGRIPSDFGKLESLINLDLSNNSLSGTIPSEIGGLTKLNDLTLKNNTFSLPKPGSLSAFSISDSAFDFDADKDGIDDGIDTDLTSAAMIQEIIDPDYSLSIHGSGRVVNIVSQSLFNKTSSGHSAAVDNEITNLLYSHFKDEFDFIMIAANNKECCAEAPYGGLFAQKRNDTKGLGQEIYDNTASAGSDGKLQGVVHFPNRSGLTTGPGLHEILHNWGNDLIETGYPAHWGHSNVGGMIGGWLPNSRTKLSDGSYQARGPHLKNYWWFNSNGGNTIPYSNLELYIMGLIGADEVGLDIKIAQDFNWVDTSNGIFEASSITTLTMDEIIAEKGPREPDHLTSQKAFRAVYVVVSEAPLTRQEWRQTDRFIYDFQLQGDDGNEKYNFWEATQGKATMEFDQLDTFLTSQATLTALVTSPVVSIVGGDKTIPDTDTAAGELVSLIATAIDANGSIATTRWLVDGVEVGTDLSASFSLPNGPTVVTFQATDDDGESSATTATITVEAPNVSPVVAITGGDRTVADSDKTGGESVTVIATATDSDGTIATTQWLVDGVEVAAGLNATLALSNGSTVVTFKATDNGGASSTTTVTITVETPVYTPTEEWPSPYNGVTPDTSYGLAFNNIGVFNSSDATIYACLRVFTNGLASSSNGISQFDIGLKVVSLTDATIQITKSRDFNTIGALNEKVQAPDCSGIFETTTSLYTDIIQVNSSVLETVWSLIDSTKLILKLVSSKELTAN